MRHGVWVHCAWWGWGGKDKESMALMAVSSFYVHHGLTSKHQGQRGPRRERKGLRLGDIGVGKMLHNGCVPSPSTSRQVNHPGEGYLAHPKGAGVPYEQMPRQRRQHETEDCIAGASKAPRGRRGAQPWHPPAGSTVPRARHRPCACRRRDRRCRSRRRRRGHPESPPPTPTLSSTTVRYRCGNHCPCHCHTATPRVAAASSTSTSPRMQSPRGARREEPPPCAPEGRRCRSPCRDCRPNKASSAAPHRIHPLPRTASAMRGTRTSGGRGSPTGSPSRPNAAIARA